MYACDNVFSLTWPIIVDKFSAEALSKLAQRLALPEITRNIIYKVAVTFNVRGVKHFILTTEHCAILIQSS